MLHTYITLRILWLNTNIVTLFCSLQNLSIELLVKVFEYLIFVSCDGLERILQIKTDVTKKLKE